MKKKVRFHKTLQNGIRMPSIGLGTYRTGIGKQTRNAVSKALEIGYRLIDTASVYGNERDVGAGVKYSGLDREDIFITTKLWNFDQGELESEKGFLRSLRSLDMDYVDLYLIHWPVNGKWKDSWKQMERFHEEGMARAIGVSNFTVEHLKELLEFADVTPAVNQVEFSPFLYQRELLQYCEENGIQLEGYSPLTKGERLDHPTITSISRTIGITPAQLMISWALHHGMVTIPKSSKEERIRENFDVFQIYIDPDTMTQLNSLDEGYRTGWDPTE